jgi:hypothetical protein
MGVRVKVETFAVSYNVLVAASVAGISLAVLALIALVLGSPPPEEQTK